MSEHAERASAEVARAWIDYEAKRERRLKAADGALRPVREFVDSFNRGMEETSVRDISVEFGDWKFGANDMTIPLTFKRPGGKENTLTIKIMQSGYIDLGHSNHYHPLTDRESLFGALAAIMQERLKPA
jgi:hypothetical protein